MTSILENTELIAQFINAARNGIPLSTACRAAGISMASIVKWRHLVTNGVWDDGHNSKPSPETRERAEAFITALDQARAEHEADMLVSITRAATVGTDEKHPPDWRAAAWFLEHSHTRSSYYRHNDSNPEPSPPPTYKSLSSAPTEELLTLTDPSWALILPPSED